MDKEVLETVIKKSARESSIMRIIDMKWESALPKGENYTSTVFILKLKVVLGNGRIANKSLILKKENVGEGTDETFKGYNFSTAEVSIYNNVLSNMECLMEEFEDTEGPLWCKLIHFNLANSTIILEDLKNLGFSTVKRRDLQDLDHARLALRSLGRFHAMAKVLEVRGQVSKNDHKPFPFLYDEVFYRAIIYGGLKALVKGMRAGWGEEWSETANRLSQISFEEFVKKMKNCANFEGDVFQCLNHGDCWNSNMMFRYNWEGKPIDIRFIDFQISHYNTPCIDVAYYMFTSIKPKLRRQYHQCLLKFYHESLTNSLDRFGFTGTKPSLEEIEQNMERLSFFALALFASGHAIDTSATSDAFDIALAFKSNGEDGFNINVFNEPGVKENIGDDVKKLVHLTQSH